MENRTRLGGLGRSRRPLGDLTAQQNNRGPQPSNENSFPIKQSFSIFRDEGGSTNGRSSRLNFNDENRPPIGSTAGPSKSITNENQQSFNHRYPPNKFPPPPPLPIATSSPATLVIRHESFRKGEFGRKSSTGRTGNGNSTSSNEDIDDSEPMVPGGSDAVDSIDPFSLISKSSASDFRRNNDSISSTTTNEDDEENPDCDSSVRELSEDEYVINPESEADVDLAAQGVARLHPDDRAQLALQDEYALDILKGMKEREVNYLPKWNYMTKQPDITFTMRSILVDWLVEVGEEYKLNTETLFLAVNFIDRFLSFMSVQRAKLQLVGTACMFIAAKYEEIYPPDVTEFCYITDDTYTKRQVLRMEQLVLGVLNFECAPPTAHFFVNHLAAMAGCGKKATALAQYLTELTMIDGEAFMPFVPSLIAAAAVALSRHTLGLAAWEDSMTEQTGYNVEDFKECLIRLHEIFERAPDMPQQAVREKYKNASFHSVSDVRPSPIF